MHILKYISAQLFILILSGCGTDSTTLTDENPALFDLYWSSYSANDENETVQHGIYGAGTLSLSSIAEINLIKDELGPCAVDSMGNIYWSASGIDDNKTISIFSSDKYGNNTQELITDFTLINGLSIDNVQERIYWSDNNGTNAKIAYSDLNGSNPQVINAATPLVSGGPLYIDTVNASLYVSDTEDGKIYRLDMDGGNPSLLPVTASKPMQLAIDYTNNKIIWTDIEEDFITRADLNGSNPELILDFSTTDANTSALVVDKANSRLLYIINGTTLQSADLNGDNNITQVSGLSPDVQSLWLVQ